MDILVQEKSKLEVLKSNSLVLLPNSISIVPYVPVGVQMKDVHPMSTQRVTLNIRYANTLFSVLVTMDNPLDFVITTPNLLPMSYFDDKTFPKDFPNTRLVDLVRWLLGNLRQHMFKVVAREEKLDSLATAIENMITMNFISENSYEMVMLGEKVTLLFKFRPEENIKLASVKEMVEEDKLINSGGHFFVLKMGFKVDTGDFIPGDFAITFSSDLSNMLPELAKFSQSGLTMKLATDLVDFLMHVKDRVDKTISCAVKGWEKRARLLTLLNSVFEDSDQAIAYLDYNTMSTIDLAFRKESAKCVLKIELDPNYPAVVPIVTFFYQNIPENGARETRGSGAIKDWILTEKQIKIISDMNEKEIVEQILDFMINVSIQKV